MGVSLQLKTKAEAAVHIRSKIHEDEGFRNRLLEDPRSVILTETGINLPEDDVTIVNREIRKGLLMTDDSDVPLTEEELEYVSGGWGTGNSSCTLPESHCVWKNRV